jgi:hypothetical protein
MVSFDYDANARASESSALRADQVVERAPCAETRPDGSRCLDDDEDERRDHGGGCRLQGDRVDEIRPDDGIVVVEMFVKPSKALMIALQHFVCRHEIFAEAREFDDGFILIRCRCLSRPSPAARRVTVRCSDT